MTIEWTLELNNKLRQLIVDQGFSREQAANVLGCKLSAVASHCTLLGIHQIKSICYNCNKQFDRYKNSKFKYCSAACFKENRRRCKRAARLVNKVKQPPTPKKLEKKVVAVVAPPVFDEQAAIEAFIRAGKLVRLPVRWAAPSQHSTIYGEEADNRIKEILVEDAVTFRQSIHARFRK